ncbi:MAG: pyridoxamine 5'-phosphate oxidase family protein [Acidobacteriota bacterium]|nr:pyridoxamine 5'-phosphate oxidase family protein [Acidobacteriota bacterium]
MPRSAEQRVADTFSALERLNHLWIATASPAGGRAHLIPVSFAWTGSEIIIATGSAGATGSSLHATGRAQLAIGQTDDVILIDAEVRETVEVRAAPDAIASRYAAQSDWDPREGTDVPTEYFVLTPVRIRAWREVGEIPGRTVMSDGAWVTEPPSREA